MRWLFCTEGKSKWRFPFRVHAKLFHFVSLLKIKKCVVFAKVTHRLHGEKSSIMKNTLKLVRCFKT